MSMNEAEVVPASAGDRVSETKEDSPQTAAEDTPVARVTQATQVLRIAATMTGGVSLAIWMGGVARELDLLCQASAWRSQLGDDDQLPVPDRQADPDASLRALYVGLLDVLDVVVDIDVLSGTSAGGINAALLAYARSCGKDLGRLRSLWTDLGSLGTLLRSPRDGTVPSLMYGDGQLLSGLHGALESMPAAPNMAPTSRVQAPLDPSSIRLFITTTLLTGETSRFTDSYGTIVQDVEHHGLFIFDRDDFTTDYDGTVRAALALAARSSASFPAAFEPSFVPFHASDATATQWPIPARPPMRRYSNITRAHWAVDGGLLANRPIRPVLQAIFDRPATEGVVRRVLLYIVPSTGDAPDLLREQSADQISRPFGLLDGLLKDLGAVASQSIAGELQEIQDHNDRVSARSDARLRLAELGSRLGAQRLLTTQSLADYTARAADSIARPVVAALLRRISSSPTDTGTNPSGGPAGSVSRTWAQFFAAATDAEVDCRQGVIDGLRQDWGREPPMGWAALAAFGRPAYDGAKAVALAILRNAYALVDGEDDRRWIAARHAEVHKAFKPPPPVNVQQFVDGACAADPALRESYPPTVAHTLAQRQLGVLVTTRDDDPGAVLSAAWQGLAGVFRPETVAQLHSMAQRSPAPQNPEPEPPGTEAPPLSPPPMNPQSRQGRRLSAATNLRIYLDYLLAAGADSVSIGIRLFDLHTTLRAVLPVSADLDQPVEFIQISSDTRSLLDPQRQTAQSKLTGMQLHHFGAFYKASWRVNDWMWGRLDGAGWLVHLLLDPRRIELKAQDRPQDGRSAADWFFDILSDPRLAGPIPETGYPLPSAGTQVNGGRLPVLTADSVRAELGYLDDPSIATPVSLPLTALWVARAWQQHITAIELPNVADTALNGPPPVAAKIRSSIAQTRNAVAHSATPGAPGDGQAADPVADGQAVIRPSRWRVALTARTNTAGSEAADEAIGAKPSTVQWAMAVAKVHARIAGGDASLADIAKKLPDCPVPNETLSSEAGSSLLTRTVTHAAATVAAAVNSIQQVPTVVRPVLSSMRTITLTGYRASSLVDPRPRRLAILGLAALVIGFACAIQQSTWLGITGTGLALAGAYLVAIAAWGTSRMLLLSLLAILLVGAMGALALPWVRRGLFGTSSADTGVVGREVHWIGSEWWHPFVVLGAILFVIALIIIALDPVGRRRTSTPKPPSPATLGRTAPGQSRS
jgi:patatin-related protein